MLWQIFMASLAFALKVTLPNILLLCLGQFLRGRQMIDARFCEQASELVFQFALPLMLFVNLVEMQIDYAANAKLVLAGAVCTMLLFLLAELYAYFRVPRVADKGVFVQGVFRSNLGIVGLAMVQNAYGAQGVAYGAVYMGLITILLNILSVLTLSRTASGSVSDKLRGIVGKIAKNPLIIMITLALICNALDFRLPEVLRQTFQYLAHLALPLALICAGATFNWQAVREASDVSLQASVGRLVVAPALAVGVGCAFGFDGVNLGVLFLMVATPAAAASYVMARAMGGNDVAAANIIAITTAGSMVSTSLGVALLRGLGWI